MLAKIVDAAFLLLSVPAAAAREPQVLAPVSKWVVHFGEESCKLGRQFGDPAKPTTLMMERIAPDAPMSLLVSGAPLRSKPDDGDAKVSFLPFAKHQFKDGNVAEVISDKSTAILWRGVDFLDGWKKEDTDYKPPKEVGPINHAETAARDALIAANSAKVTGVLITEPNKRQTLLQTGPMRRVYELMETCARDQLAGWGLDPDVQEKVVLPPVSLRSLAMLFSSDDYPKSALTKGEQALITARLMISPEGKVTKCTSLTPFKAEEMAKITCDKLRRAVFRPAELADGTKVPTFVTTRIQFRMP